MPIGMRKDAYRLVVEMILKSRQHPTNESFAEHTSFEISIISWELHVLILKTNPEQKHREAKLNSLSSFIKTTLEI